MNYYRPSEQERFQSEEVVLENPSFYGRMKNRAKNAAYSVGRGIKSVGSYAYNQILGRDGNFNVLTQTGNNRSAFVKRKLRRTKTKKSRKRRVTKKRN